MTAADALILLNLVILESLLSIDNAAVLAVMVRGLPKNQQSKALKYGIAGAFLFRGICLLLAAWLIKILWLKIVGGIYLIYIAIAHFTPKRDSIEEGVDTEHNSLFLRVKKYFGLFWSTVILIEAMDLAFSIDNVFAAVAMTDKFWLIITGVCIGIVAMRFVATKFVLLMNRYPSLENSAFAVIWILGLKLVMAGAADYIPGLESTGDVLKGHTFDLVFSGAMMVIFIIPILFTAKRQKAPSDRQ